MTFLLPEFGLSRTLILLFFQFNSKPVNQILKHFTKQNILESIFNGFIQPAQSRFKQNVLISSMHLPQVFIKQQFFAFLTNSLFWLSNRLKKRLTYLCLSLKSNWNISSTLNWQSFLKTTQNPLKSLPTNK